MKIHEIPQLAIGWQILSQSGETKKNMKNLPCPGGKNLGDLECKRRQNENLTAHVS